MALPKPSEALTDTCSYDRIGRDLHMYHLLRCTLQTRCNSLGTPEVVRRQPPVLEMLCALWQTADPRFQNFQACACSLLIRFAERTGAVENLQSVCTLGDCASRLINARSSPYWGVPTAEFLAQGGRRLALSR